MKSLVGYTGFVGQNICAKASFDGLYNSKNIEDSFGSKPELLVFSGLPAEKFLANKNPEQDIAKVNTAIENIKKIVPQQIVLISTIDVYPTPVDVDEDSQIPSEGGSYYGKHRLILEKFVENYSPNNLVIRLPGLYGKGIKKNFIYDLIHIIPSLLNEKKYKELSEKSALIKDSYTLNENGFYKLNSINDSEKIKLKEEFEHLNFTALNFTDSRGLFQFYNLENLWNDIQTALSHNIRKLNIATEPIRIDELHSYITGTTFKNEILENNIPHYDFKSKYATFFGGKNGYLYDKNSQLAGIKKFVKESQNEIFHI